MATKKRELINNEIYHIVVRGAGDLPIFEIEEDYLRATNSLCQFNSNNSVSIRDLNSSRPLGSGRKSPRPQGSGRGLSADNNLVEILAFCFMPNHIHLLLRQSQDNGISKFMIKFGGGYAGYFNRRHERRGHLFQGRFLSVRIKNDNQLRNIFVYIHANPISLIYPLWKEKGIADLNKAVEFIESFRWSSYGDYLEKQSCDLPLSKIIFEEIIEKENYRLLVDQWLRYKSQIDDKIILE